MLAPVSPTTAPVESKTGFDGYIEILLAAAVGDLRFMTRPQPGFDHPPSDFGAVFTLFSFEDVTRRLSHDFARRARNLRIIPRAPRPTSRAQAALIFRDLGTVLVNC
jgi:hypothetical protein